MKFKEIRRRSRMRRKTAPAPTRSRRKTPNDNQKSRFPDATLNMLSTNDDGIGICVWVEFKGARKGAKALLDTGAGISLLPKRIFDAVRKQQRARLRPTDRNIKAVNGKAIECFWAGSSTAEHRRPRIQTQILHMSGRCIGVARKRLYEGREYINGTC